MAGPFTIQRIPRGLLNVLGNYGGQTPPELAQQTVGVMDILQMYGLTQLQTGFLSNAALAEGGNVIITPSVSSWTILFSCSNFLVKTATMTAARTSIAINRVTQFGVAYHATEWGPFGATETGTASDGFILPYPLLCPPGTTVTGNLAILGTDATANYGVFAEFGVLG